MLTIIIPIYNEEKVLSGNPSVFRELARHAELIFVDGASTDRSRSIASQYGRVLSSPKGRALQMNLGGRASHGDTLLFLHADTAVTPDTISSIKNIIATDNVIGGCLTQRIEKDGFAYRFIEGFGNARAKITKVFYGDQGIFVAKEAFIKTGGFPEVLMMEDVLFTKKLRKTGKAVVLPDKIFVSPRRWEQKGVFKTALLYSLLNILFWLKISPRVIKKLYGDLR